MATLEINGQIFETRNLRYGYYDTTACKIVDMRGDFDAYRAPDTVLLHAEQLSDGWTRYFTYSADADEQASIAELASLT